MAAKITPEVPEYLVTSTRRVVDSPAVTDDSDEANDRRVWARESNCKHTPEEALRMKVGLLQKGWTTAEIAQRYSKELRTVQCWLADARRELGLPPAKPSKKKASTVEDSDVATQAG
jgi:transposase